MKKVLVLGLMAAFALTMAAVPSQAKIDVTNETPENMNRVVTERTRVSTFVVSNDVEYSATSTDLNNTGGNWVMGGDDVEGVTIYSGDADTDIDTMTDINTTKINDTSASDGGPDVALVNSEADCETCGCCGNDGENMNDLYESDDEFSDYIVDNESEVEKLDVAITNTGINGTAGADDVGCVEIVSGRSTHTRTDNTYVDWTEITRAR